MFRTPMLAALAVALMGSAALAAPQTGAPDDSNGPPAQLSAQADGPPGDRAYDDRDNGPDMDRDGDREDAPPQRNAQAQDPRSRDLFCRRDAAARTGYVTPGEAARHEQTNGTIGGTLGGAALGAIIGGASGNAGAGAAIGAGAGLVAGTAVGADNARAAASDVQARYGAAYYACMDEADGGPGPADYAGGYGPGYDGPPPPPPPPPPGYYGYGPYPYPYYAPYYYGPSVSFGFGYGGYRHGWGGHRGGHHR